MTTHAIIEVVITVILTQISLALWGFIIWDIIKNRKGAS